MYLFSKGPCKAKYQFLISKQKSTSSKHLNDSKPFMEYPNNMDNIYKNIEEYNPNQKHKILIVFDDMVADMISNKKLNSLVSELFIRRRELKLL